MAGTSVLESARMLDVDIDSACGGRALCGRCLIDILDSKSSHLSSVGKSELKFIQSKNLPSNHRLSCMAKIRGDVVIKVPPESQKQKLVVRKELEVRDIPLKQALKLYFVRVSEPCMPNTKGDLQRLQDALSKTFCLKLLDCDISVLRELQGALRKGDWKVSVGVYGDRQIIGIWPGFKEKVYGLAVDVGSTTIAANLCDMTTGEVINSKGILNPQSSLGEDVMSRLSFIMMNPGGEEKLTALVRNAINDLIEKVARDSGIEAGDILEMTFVANPIMQQLLLGIDPTELGGAPFTLATNGAVSLPAKEIGIVANQNSRCYLLPSIAGYVGGDTAGVILAESPHTRKEVTLIVDIGTNAEIVLGNRERLLVCSSPTGPAFEGAQISYGQIAAPGAIERIRIDPQTLEPVFKIIGSKRWSNEADFKESTGNLKITGICGSGIIEAIGEMFLTSIVSADGVIDGELTGKSSRIVPDGRTFSYVLVEGTPGIRITQNDIRAIQLAKAALYAGVKLLMDKLGVNHVDRIRFAGAFGSQIDVKYAMLLGMIPDCDLERVSSAGNAAGTGARIALLDRKAREEIEKFVTGIEKIETAIEDRFQEYFVDAMAFPHKRDPFPNLSKKVNLPVTVNESQLKTSSGRRVSRRRKLKNTS